MRITHEWVERSTSRPPAAPPSAVYPPDAGEAEGTDIVFRWNAPQDNGGDKIVDYHFELSDRADMNWPLSTELLQAHLPDRGQGQAAIHAAQRRPVDARQAVLLARAGEE